MDDKPEHFERISLKLAEKREEPQQQSQVTARTTIYVVFACTVSASAGLLFGYDGGVSGGVSNMEGFQTRFFPAKASDALPHTYYCKHNDQILQLFASVMYFAGAAVSMPGSLLSKRFGRTMTMTVAGTSFLVGSIILAGAIRTSMLLLGRVFWGIGVGLADQAATIYSSEMAPPHVPVVRGVGVSLTAVKGLRGTLTMLFQLCTVTGILLAQCLNIATHYIHPFGWRISLGLAAIPGLVLLVGGLFLPETPNSLIERGYLQRGRAVLEAIRGTQDVDAEYGTILKAYQREKGNGDNQFKTLMKRSLRPHLTMSIACPFFQQWTGINAVIFFSPFIFQSMGDKFKGETGSLIATVIVGAVQEVGTILGMLIVDRVGRRKMLIQSTIQSLVAQLVLAIVFAVSTDSSTVMMGAVPARASIILICIFVFSYGYGWGPMGWVISSEIQPLETRCLGQGITVFFSLLNGAIIGQSFLTMLCRMEWGVYVLFAAMQVLATVFCIFFLPETTGIPIEMVKDVFRVHWYWKRFHSADDTEGAAIQRELVALLDRRREAQSKGNSSKTLLGKLTSPRASRDSDKPDSSPGKGKPMNSRASGDKPDSVPANEQGPQASEPVEQ